MKRLAYAAAAFLALGQTASAATVSQFTNDVTFNALCNQGTNDLDCEVGVAELRGGNFAVNGTFETALRTPTSASYFGNSAQGQTAWQSGEPTRFTFRHEIRPDDQDPTDDADSYLVLSLETVTDAGVAPVVSSIEMNFDDELENDPEVQPLSEVTTLFLRSRSNLFGDATLADETSALTELLFRQGNGDVIALPDNVPTASGFQGAAYIGLSGVDFAAEWMLTGLSTFSFPNGVRNAVDDSALAHQFKLTDVSGPEVVPLPASWLLLLAALGGARMLRPVVPARRGA